MTPCEEKGYKVGDRFVAKGCFWIPDGSTVELYDDDGTDLPLLKVVEGTCQFDNADGPGAWDNIEEIEKIEEYTMIKRITLKPGDYVATEGMNEATYHAVARAFIEAGAIDKGDADFDKNRNNLGWDYRDNELWHTDGRVGGFTNKLSVADILGTPSTTTDLVAAVRTAKATLDDARADYTKSLDALREALGEGFVIVEAGETPEPDEPDLTDPANWRAGDLVTCLADFYFGYRKGVTYSLYSGLEFDSYDRVGVIGDDGRREKRMAKNFRFHHRPNT